jgi:hypothetical protein
MDAIMVRFGRNKGGTVHVEAGEHITVLQDVPDSAIGAFLVDVDTPCLSSFTMNMAILSNLPEVELNVVDFSLLLVSSLGGNPRLGEVRLFLGRVFTFTWILIREAINNVIEEVPQFSAISFRIDD